MIYNQWKETVRWIYDELHFGKQTIYNNDLARKIIDKIEDNHHDYFLESSEDK